MRYGTRTEVGRHWMPCGERPVCPVKLGYEFGYLYTAICPYNGDLFAMFLPNMKRTCFDIFAQNLAEQKKSNPYLRQSEISYDRYSKRRYRFSFFTPCLS